MKNWLKDFLDDISGVLFAPSVTLNNIAREKKILQAVIILILSGLLPEVASFRRIMNEDFLRFSPGGLIYGMGGAAFSMAHALPYIATLIIIGGIIIIPLLHFIFTATVELTCQFMAQDRAKKAPPNTSGKASIPSGTGVGLFASMAFATFPMILMVPVNLISTLTEINLTLLFGVMLRLWVIVLQVIAVRETHGFTTGRATLAYFALPLLGIAFALVMIIVLLTMAAPLIPHMI